MKETDAVSVIKGVGEKTRESLETIGIHTVGDLIRHYPLRYDTFDPPSTIAERSASLPEDGSAVTAVFCGRFASEPKTFRAGGLVRTTVNFSDGTGTIKLTWFRMPYLAGTLKDTGRRIVRGRFLRTRYGLQMEQPALFTEEEYTELTERLQPVYAVSGRLSTKQVAKYIRQALEDLPLLADPLPQDLRETYSLAERNYSLHTIHFPRDKKELLSARRRLVFEEFLSFIWKMRSLKERKADSPNPWDFSGHSYAEKLLQSLPYELTEAQKKVWAQIREDMNGDVLMNRLIQGDVGSGKTILAALALVTAAENGFQSVMMAPTEVLAAQHYESLSRLFESAGLPIRCALLTGSLPAAAKRRTLSEIAEHEVDVILGTHALIQEKVKYDTLSLVITDEQHRFGVRQRKDLADKGRDPHTLVMSATPIPRTLAIILYGDLDISVVDKLPSGRIPIKNCVVGPSYRKKAYEFIRKQVEAGHQAYVICPMVEESEGLDAENVTDYTQKIREALPENIQVEMLHGKMKPKEKNARMEEFLAGKIQVLVSTTVVEVGVNVPNATVMMVENAERFGLAQLHQLRGRVGRGKDASYCIFVDGSGDPAKNRRLQILNHSNDGFEIASEDLKLRGPGDAFGIRQSGDLPFLLGDIYTDASILQEAAEACDRILAEDPGLQSDKYHTLAGWLQGEDTDSIPVL